MIVVVSLFGYLLLEEIRVERTGNGGGIGGYMNVLNRGHDHGGQRRDDDSAPTPDVTSPPVAGRCRGAAAAQRAEDGRKLGQNDVSGGRPKVPEPQMWARSGSGNASQPGTN